MTTTRCCGYHYCFYGNHYNWIPRPCSIFACLQHAFQDQGQPRTSWFQQLQLHCLTKRHVKGEYRVFSLYHLIAGSSPSSVIAATLYLLLFMNQLILCVCVCACVCVFCGQTYSSAESSYDCLHPFWRVCHNVVVVTRIQWAWLAGHVIHCQLFRMEAIHGSQHVS